MQTHVVVAAMLPKLKLSLGYEYGSKHSELQVVLAVFGVIKNPLEHSQICNVVLGMV